MGVILSRRVSHAWRPIPLDAVSLDIAKVRASRSKSHSIKTDNSDFDDGPARPKTAVASCPGKHAPDRRPAPDPGSIETGIARLSYSGERARSEHARKIALSLCR